MRRASFTHGAGSRSATPIDNGSLPRKIALRRWLLARHRAHAPGAPVSVLDCYGPHGEMHKGVWEGESDAYAGTQGGAYTWLMRHQLDAYTLFDVDAYGSPYECVEAIASQLPTRDRLYLVATDGALKKEAMYRANIPRFLQARMGWPRRDDHLMAAIYWRYPSYLRAVLERLTARTVEHLAVVPSPRAGAVMYWAAVLRFAHESEKSRQTIDSEGDSVIVSAVTPAAFERRRGRRRPAEEAGT